MVSGPQSFSLSQARAETVATLTRSPLDILIVGGGIVGAGIARDAAMRGLRIGLLDQHDFAFGTSSRSTRLLHGGLRYLAQARLGLVREASVEKQVLHRIAPHLAAPLAFVFPTYRGSGWPRWQMRIGVKLYDLLCSGHNLGKSSTWSLAEARTQLPKLKAEQLTGAVRYFDALTNDARLVLDTLRSAAGHGALLLNYCQFQAAAREGGLWTCHAREQLAGRSFEIRADSVVNAAGPWAANLPHSRVKLRLTKGIHLVVPRSRLPTSDAVVITEGRRLLFVVPWGERLILGTTDTDYHGSLDEVRAQPEDIAYVLRSVSEFFPAAAISEKDIISVWAGLRPLLANPDGRPSEISRAHQIRTAEPGWWDVAGGKLTIYRLMAEQTVDWIVKWLKESGKLNKENRAGSNRRTVDEPFPGGKTSPEQNGTWVCRTAQEPLLDPRETEGVSAILPPEFQRSAVEHYCSREWAVHLADVMIRRTSWHYYFADASEKAVRVADWMSQILGWSPVLRQAELAAYRAETNR